MSFDRLAPHYSRMEWVLAGRLLHRCRTTFLDAFAGGQNILLIGEGHGRFLEEILRRNEGARVVVLDSSAGMLRQAAARLSRAGLKTDRVRFLNANVTSAELDGRFDRIATHFFLDCFPEPELPPVVERIANWLEPGGLWSIADFQVPPRGLKRWRARAVLALAYAFFRAAAGLRARRLAPPGPLLAGAGLRQAGRAEFNAGLLYSELWTAAEKARVASPRRAGVVGQVSDLTIGVGARVKTLPRPPNRTGGFPASGSPERRLIF